MKVISQVEAQRKILEETVSTALELASGKSDGAEVAVSKTTGISVSTRYGEVENVDSVAMARWHHCLSPEPQR
ncbi:hypothetical protein ACLK15_24760 [Escherichia coli]